MPSRAPLLALLLACRPAEDPPTPAPPPVLRPAPEVRELPWPRDLLAHADAVDLLSLGFERRGLLGHGRGGADEPPPVQPPLFGEFPFRPLVLARAPLAADHHERLLAALADDICPTSTSTTSGASTPGGASRSAAATTSCASSSATASASTP